MTSIKDLLEVGDKRTQGEWSYSAEDGLYPTLSCGKETLSQTVPYDSTGLGFEDAEYCASAPKMEAKLRQMVEVLPAIRSALDILWEMADDNNAPNEGMNRLLAFLDEWENK